MTKTVKIFDIDYLINSDYTDDDLYHLFATKSLTYSLIVAQFKLAGYKETVKDIKTVVKKKHWQYKYFFNDQQIADFEDKVTKIYKKVYQCSDAEALSRAQMFYVQYGFSNIRIKNNKYTNYLDE